jgi:hypothetical protein
MVANSSAESAVVARNPASAPTSRKANNHEDHVRRESFAPYLRLVEGDLDCGVARLTADVALDFAEGEKLVGIEVLGASRLFDTPDAPAVELQDLIARSAAA